MWRNVASNGLTLLVVVVFLLGGLIAWAKSQYFAAGPLETAICLRVEGGQKVNDVAAQLSAEGAITSPALFRMGADYTERSQNLKAGSFLVREGSSMEDITAIITGTGRSTCGTEVNFRVGIVNNRIVVSELNPQSNELEEVTSFEPGVDGVPAKYVEAKDETGVRFRITIAEGATSWQVMQALNSADFMSGEVSETPDEGTLAPESYDVESGSERAAIIATMSERQVGYLAELWESRAPGLPLESIEEALILASIVEKETGIAEERPQVASVFVNRLKQGIRLQTDPTVIYGLTKGQSILGRGLRQSELRGNTPWNTYVIDGLPPTPIANPGRAAIEATLNPAETPYLFFVADGTGGHAFAETLSEHNDNVARWRKIEAERQEADQSQQ